MKLSTFISFMVIVAGIFFIFTSIINEGEKAYTDVSINTSQWEGKYDYSDDINSSVTDLQEKFNAIEDENNGWFSKLTAGISAIPKAVILIPTVLFKSLTNGGTMVTNFLTIMGIPVELILLIVLLIAIWGIFKLVEVFQRWQV